MNDKPYYSRDNGFDSAAAVKGITEALQEHLNIIVRDENLEIEFNHDHYQAEIEDLVEDKERLEQQKTQRQNAIVETTEELNKKAIELAELKVKLESPAELLETSEGSRIVELNEEIRETISNVESKKVEKAKLETDLESPTQVELDALNTDGSVHQSSGHWFSNFWHWFSNFLKGAPKLLFKIFATVVVIVLFGYLYLFYVSAGEKTVKEEKDININVLIDFEAFANAWNPSKKTVNSNQRNNGTNQDNNGPNQVKWYQRNWLVLTFPFIFLFLAIATHLSLEHESRKKWLYFWGFLIVTLLIEGIIGWKIAHSIVAAQGKAQTGEQDNPLFLTALFILLGFGPSVLLGCGLQWVLGLWENIRPQTDQSKQMEIQIRSEQNEKLGELSVLNTELQNLEDNLIRLDEEQRTYTESLVKTYKHPIEAQITGLETEIQSIQDEIQLLNEQVDSLQMEIDRCESEINNYLKGQRNRIVDIKKMEAQVEEFVTGWCQYVTQHRTSLQPEELSSQILNIQELKQQVIEDFKQL